MFREKSENKSSRGLLGPARNSSSSRSSSGGAHDDLVNAEDGDGGIDSETERLRLGVDMVKDGGLGAAWQAYRGPGKCYTQERALAATRYIQRTERDADCARQRVMVVCVWVPQGCVGGSQCVWGCEGVRGCARVMMR